MHTFFLRAAEFLSKIQVTTTASPSFVLRPSFTASVPPPHPPSGHSFVEALLTLCFVFLSSRIAPAIADDALACRFLIVAASDLAALGGVS